MSSPNEQSKRNDIQGIRGVAITYVILFHFFPELFPNGYVGVDIFFVISGYLIVRILERTIDKKGALDVSDIGTFYFRRVRRIFPLYFTFCLTTTLLLFYFAPSLQMEQAQKSALSALIFVTNVKEMFYKFDYFERVLVDDPFTHTWSLAIEIQFYLLVPIIILASNLLCSRGTTRWLLVAAAASSLLLHSVSSNLISFNLVFARLWQFLAVLCAQQCFCIAAKPESTLPLNAEDNNSGNSQSISHSPWSPLRDLLQFLSIVSLLAPLVRAPLLNALQLRLTLTAASAYLIWSGDNEDENGWRWPHRLLSVRPLVWLGDISYSLYLIHWPLTVYFAHGTDVFSPVRLLLIAISLLLAWISFSCLENSYREWSVFTTSCTVSVLFATTLAIIIFAPKASELRQPTLEIQDPAIIENERAFTHFIDDLFISHCRYTTWKNLTVHEQNEAMIFKPFGMCDMMPGEGRLRFLVIGNSYAPNQAELVWKHFRPFFSTLTLFSRAACEVLAFSSPYPSCSTTANFTEVIDFVKPDIIFLIQRYHMAKNPPSPEGEDDKILVEMQDRMQSLEDRSSLVFFMDSIPLFKGKVIFDLNSLIARNVSADEINRSAAIPVKDAYARPRTKSLADKCKKCVLYDIEPALGDAHFPIRLYDGATRLAFFEPMCHLTPAGKRAIEPVYRKLAEDYGARLREMRPRDNNL